MIRPWLATAVAVAAFSPSATAQPTEARVDAAVVAGWFGAERPLRIDVRITTTRAVPDSRLSVAIGERVRSRSALGAALDEVVADPLHAFTVALPDMAADESRQISVRRTVSDLGAFRGAPDGIYPVSVSLRSSTGPALASVTTAAAFIGSPPVKPLRVLSVMRVAGPPLPPDISDAQRGAAAALVRSAVDAAVDAGAAVAVSPVLLDQLGDVGIRDGLRRLPAGALLDVPYSNTVLAHLGDIGLGDLDAQLVASRTRLAEVAGTATSPVMLPPALVLDRESLGRLGDAGVRAALVTTATFGPQPTTPALPIADGGVTLVPVDTALTRAAGASATDADVANVVADAAMTYFEAPGRTRTVALVVDHDTGRGADVLSTIAAAPWVTPLTTGDIVALAPPAGTPFDSGAPPPPDAYLRELSAGRSAVADLRSFTLDGNPARSRLLAALRAAASTAWWLDDWDAGRRSARDVTAAVGAERAQISAAGEPVTFTSRRGEIPIVITNDADYPVRVRLQVSSPKLTFPEGDSRVLDPLPPPGRTVTLPALASGSGTFALTVQLTSPDGRVLVDSDEIVVRSLAVNATAVVLTAGAALFLAAWVGRRIMGRKRAA